MRDTDTNTHTHSYSYFNSAAYAYAQRQSNTKGSPNSSSSPVRKSLSMVERVVLNALANGTAALPPNYLRLQRFLVPSSSEKPIHLIPVAASLCRGAR
jgi:hypothetical protein